jgi:uncharacterized membrane protein
MSTDALELAVLRFDGENAAVDHYARARDAAFVRGSTEGPRWTRDVGFVERHHNGRLLMRGMFAGHYLDLDEGDDFSQRGAGEGAATGGLLGVLAGPPGIAVGLVLGMFVGAHAGSPDQAEAEPPTLAEQMRDAVPRSSSAIVMVAAPEEVEELVGAVGDGAAETVRRALAGEEVAALEAALGEAPAAGGA